jgi:NADH:ubiquinone oxidoreductase subunit 2 (subunit N)
VNCLAETLLLTAGALPLIPLVASLGIALMVVRHGGEAVDLAAADNREPPTARLALLAAWSVLLLLLAMDVAAFWVGVPGQVSYGNWMTIGVEALPLAFSVDALSLGVATAMAFVALITLRFSRQYLHREAGFHRFFLVMGLFFAGMLLIVLAGTAVLAFVGWELAGVSSYLLIGYAYDRDTASRNALFAILTNRIGDGGFLIGIALAFVYVGSVAWADFGSAADPLDPLIARLMALCFVTAALVKSSQLPFSSWIARALEGPTPSSAIFYGAVMIHAGVYLVLRLEPLLRQVPDVMLLLAVVGAATALYGWLVGMVQTDIKSSLVFATLSQVGLMFLACGLGFFTFAAVHLVAHTLWRAYQFLRAPGYVALMPRPAPVAPLWLTGRGTNTRGRQWLYTAALQRFWLDALARATVQRPFQSMAEDARRLDDEVIGPLAGAPQPNTSKTQAAEAGDAVIHSPGLVGRVLLLLADRLQQFESRLILHGGDTPLSRAMQSAGGYLRAAEALLEQPRYLLVLVIATFVVIL